MARDPFVVKKAFRRNSNVDGLFRKFSNFSNLEGVRVKSIILDDSTIEGWAALGAIEYQSINSNFTARAYPLNSNSKCFPLINEIVYIISLPSSDMNKANTRKKTYYISNVGIWNHPHHNAFPPNPDNLTETQKNDYVSKGQDTDTTEDDVTIRQIQDSTGIYLGKTFKERSNIHPLLPFEGDFIQEGRWGNSLRFGSTVQETSNDWSMYGTNGDPITILRNGQGNQTEEGWTPIVEDINNDNSSIYLTSTQDIPLNISSTDYTSYSGSASPSNQYDGSQIILNSGKLTFNSKQDHILLSSAKSINLNAQESVNIDTRNCIVSATKIYLGGRIATEPLMLGDRTINFLKLLLSSVTELNNTLKNLKSLKVEKLGDPITFDSSLYAKTAEINTTLEDLKDSLDNKTLTSERNFTI